ncbi:MAG TPA: hypothetical protein VGV59_10815 [Pyrinomonadaceae bacterium]|nr:hypothetical protein [Pyrinomonadaceae bacterium]
MKSNAAQNNVRRARAAGSPLLSALLLLLFAHAFMASATHFHRPASAGATSAANSAPTASYGVRDEADTERDASFHAQCLLCRLQRNFISDLAHADARTAATPQTHEGGTSHLVLSFSQGTFLIPAGRAPPLA